METLPRIVIDLPTISEDNLTIPNNNKDQRFRPTVKAIDAELSNPDSEGITWEQLIERLCEIFQEDEVNIDEASNVSNHNS